MAPIMTDHVLALSSSTCDLMQVVVRVRPMNERELFTSDPTAVQVDEQDPQQMQVSTAVPSALPGENRKR